jgi:secreted trypsin-like serine protease
MSEVAHILEALEQIQRQVDEIKDALGRLQAQAEIEAAALKRAPTPAVVPPTAPQVEIMGGEETAQFPDCCAVGSDEGYYCSGTLIAPNVVVTADHCHDVTRVFLRGNNVDEPENGEVVRVVAQHSHPEVDLRVLVLEKEVDVPPRHVAQGAEVEAAREAEGKKIATLAGFGTIDPNGRFGYGRKRRVDVSITSLDCSGAGHAKLYGCLPGREMVAGHRGLLLDSCSGDSGGPLYVQNEDGEYYLLGATSRGSRDSFTTCGDGGVYVRVDLCLDWIRQVTGAEFEGLRT